jgi:Lrp/AsnC family leucine-responsive transcriptional regulator
MDRRDGEIIKALQREGRCTQQEIAQRAGLSQPAVAERIRKLEDRGVIKGYTARVNAGLLGLDITAFVGVAISHPKHFDGFDKRIAELPEVLEAHRVAGRDSYLFKVQTTNTTTLDHLLVAVLRTIPGVTRTETTVALASVKEDAALPILAEEDPHRRIDPLGPAHTSRRAVDGARDPEVHGAPRLHLVRGGVAGGGALSRRGDARRRSTEPCGDRAGRPCSTE